MQDKLKKCKDCGIEKPVSDYYLCRGIPLSRCKVCHKRYTSRRSQERYRSDPGFRERILSNARGWSKTHRKECNERQLIANANHKEKYPEKAYCRMMTKRIDRKGKECHHWSYERCHAKDVIFLDKSSHTILHMALRYDQDMFKYRVKETGELLDSKEKHISFIQKLELDYDTK